MRALALTTLLLGSISIPAAALAQQGPTRSVDDYVCAFTDDCADAAAEDEAAVADGATEVTVGGRKARTSSTRGFSLARPKAAEPAAKAGARAGAQTASKARVGGKKPVATAATASRAGVKTAAAKTSKSKAAATAPRRVDLRLTFELGSATLTPQAMEEARVFAEALKAPSLAERRFTIEGHTDSIGDRASNLDLSRRRAQAVKDYLTSLGVPASRLETVGYGFDRPLEGRSARAEENRRVEAVLVS